MNVDDYFKSLEHEGFGLREFISDLQLENPEIKILKEEDPFCVFYTKSLFEAKDKGIFYYFEEKKVTLIEYISGEELKIKSNNYSDIVDATISLKKAERVELFMEFSNGTQIAFDSKLDSNGIWDRKCAKQIKKIYNLIKD